MPLSMKDHGRIWGDNGQGLAYEPLLAHGTILPANTTAFAVDALALDEATAAVEEMIRGEPDLITSNNFLSTNLLHAFCQRVAYVYV